MALRLESLLDCGSLQGDEPLVMGIGSVFETSVRTLGIPAEQEEGDWRVPTSGAAVAC